MAATLDGAGWNIIIRLIYIDYHPLPSPTSPLKSTPLPSPTSPLKSPLLYAKSKGGVPRLSFIRTNTNHRIITTRHLPTHPRLAHSIPADMLYIRTRWNVLMVHTSSPPPSSSHAVSNAASNSPSSMGIPVLA